MDADAGADTTRDGVREELDRVQEIRQRFWGTRQRNIILDAHTLGYLRFLGVPTDARLFSHGTLEQLDLIWERIAPRISVLSAGHVSRSCHGCRHNTGASTRLGRPARDRLG